MGYFQKNYVPSTCSYTMWKKIVFSNSPSSKLSTCWTYTKIPFLQIFHKLKSKQR